MASAVAQLDALIAQLEASLGVPAASPLPVRSTGPAPQLDALVAQLEVSLGLAPGESTKPSQADCASESKTQAPKQATTDKPKKQKQPKQQKQSEQPAETKQPESTGELDISAVEFRVGKIVNVWNHPDSEKLYCEEIDIGEDAPRQIASGLAKVYTLEEMQNRRIIVVCNLKPRKLAGFKSCGMVLCATNEGNGNGEETKVEFIDPPADAEIGELITAEGLTGGPMTASMLDKKKVFQAVAPDLLVDGEGVVVWRGHKLRTKTGPLTAPTVRNGIAR